MEEFEMVSDEKIDLFVPGRICLFGEHSDWAGGYRRINSAIRPGRCIIAGTNQGLYARVRAAKGRLIYRTKLADGESVLLDEPMDGSRLLEIAREGGFWSYIAGVAYQMLTHYSVGGVEIDNYRTDLPLKKGLSSSAATCVLTARAFNRVYDLRMTVRGEMDIAYRGEITTPSRCGRMDQGCAYGGRPIVMDFDGDSIDVDELPVGGDLHFVIVDLNSRKDTVKILSALNRAYPFAENEPHRIAQECLGAVNERVVEAASSALRRGDAEALGSLMVEAQAEFDRALAPLCPEELTAPVLHRLLGDLDLKSLVWGGKGVGSQGDGSAQFIARGQKEQDALVAMLTAKGFGALPLTIRKSRRIKKAVITAAGFGTRLFPMTKVVRKEFLPIVDRGLLKPLILKQVEDAIEAGVEEVFLIVQEDEVGLFKKLFSDQLKPEHYAKLGVEARKVADELAAIGSKVRYIIQEEQGGLGHAALMAAEATGGECFALVLGDHVLKSEHAGRSCLQQLLDAAESEDGNLIGVIGTAEAEVRRFGCVGGNWQDRDGGLLSIDRFVEKPDAETAREYLVIEGLPPGEYLSVAGIYIITPSIAAELRSMNAARDSGGAELELTTALERVRRKEGFLGLRIAGTKEDIGTVASWDTKTS
jgi:UTP-glucose-1-phosphate uridylyltransferase/mevalonate kinase